MTKCEDTIYCTKCGSKNDNANSFCLNCGNELLKENSQNTNSNSTDKCKNNVDNLSKKMVNKFCDDVDKNDVNDFILKNVSYYNEKFNQIEKTGNKITWNWPAFFFNNVWFLYRKMYVQFAILFLVSLFLGYIPVLGMVIKIGLPIACGMYGNWAYLNHINKNLNEINALGHESKDMLIAKRGGTNIIIPLIFVAVISIFLIIFTFFFGMLFNELLYY